MAIGRYVSQTSFFRFCASHVRAIPIFSLELTFFQEDLSPTSSAGLGLHLTAPLLLLMTLP